MAGLTPAETSFVVRRLVAARPHLAAFALIVHPNEMGRLCRDELSGVDVRADGWDIRARWFGVVVTAPVGQGRPPRIATLEWRAVAGHLRSPC